MRLRIPAYPFIAHPQAPSRRPQSKPPARGRRLTCKTVRPMSVSSSTSRSSQPTEPTPTDTIRKRISPSRIDCRSIRDRRRKENRRHKSRRYQYECDCVPLVGDCLLAAGCCRGCYPRGHWLAGRCRRPVRPAGCPTRLWPAADSQPTARRRCPPPGCSQPSCRAGLLAAADWPTASSPRPLPAAVGRRPIGRRLARRRARCRWAVGRRRLPAAEFAAELLAAGCAAPSCPQPLPDRRVRRAVSRPVAPPSYPPPSCRAAAASGAPAGLARIDLPGLRARRRPSLTSAAVGCGAM